MIERKLIVGRYLVWNAPAQTNNGAVAAGIQRLNQTLLHINESTRPHLFGPKTSTMAVGHVAKAHRNYQWLEWRPGFVSEVVQNGFDVLTGPMSGCWITRYVRGGGQCVGHVGTEHTAGSPSSIAAKQGWNNFAATAPGVKTGFNPFRAWHGAYPTMDMKTDGAPKLFGVVTGAGLFYTLFTFPQLSAPNTVRIAGLQRCASNLPAHV